MYKAMPTMPVSDLRTKQAAILTNLHEAPILLTQRGRGAGVLVHPDLWNEMVELLDDYEDILVAKERMKEAESEPSVMRPISDLRASLEADGLLDA
ncbi:MAG: type II toxin-antitoxin system Phd/YefM family antitoxin [Chloroflexi bacterium]|nr:type II toxin-antitoxin system Phd/YefM family antitoxin [Chloroflexota bacterium]